jgi:hypothetical protein
MTQGILIIQVDGSEETPMKVVADVNAARDYILSHENEMGDESQELDEIQVVEFERNMTEALDAHLGVHYDIDVQFESGFGSWDYRLVQVDVEL